jgi:hypothetical protein
MQLDLLRAIEHVHGHLGWLGAVALVHPAIVLRNRERRAHLAVALSTTLVTVAAAMGVCLYGTYREKLRQGIFQTSPFVGLLFERKEHLALGAVLFAWAGAVAYVAAARATPATSSLLRRIAFRAYCAAAALAVVVASLGTVVAIHRTF